MTDENRTLVDGDWKCDFVFDGAWAWGANCASAENDRGQRDESAPGRDLERLLAGVFGRDGGASGDSDGGERDAPWRVDCLDVRGDDGFQRRAAVSLPGTIVSLLRIVGRRAVLSRGRIDRVQTDDVRW